MSVCGTRTRTACVEILVKPYVSCVGFVLICCRVLDSFNYTFSPNANGSLLDMNIKIAQRCAVVPACSAYCSTVVCVCLYCTPPRCVSHSALQSFHHTEGHIHLRSLYACNIYTHTHTHIPVTLIDIMIFYIAQTV